MGNEFKERETVMLNNTQTGALIDRLSALEGPMLSVYADVNPANPDNKGKAWRTRIRKALMDIPEIHKRTEHRPSLFDAIMELVDQDRPDARTVALFAKQNHLGKTFVERVDLDVSLPVVDLREGRVEARYGEPWIVPLVYALDEYERTAVLHLDGAKWRLFEVFMGDIREVDDIFAELDDQDWKELKEAADFIRSGELRVKVEPDLSGSTKDAWSKKMGHWRHKLYVRLARLLDKALRALGVDRLVLMGDDAETTVFRNVLPKHLRDKVVALVSNPKDLNKPNVGDIKARVFPVLEEAERAAEMQLLDEIREQPGIWGLGKVVDALQIGQIDTLVVPFDIDATILTCPDEGLISTDPALLEEFCSDIEEVALRDRVFQLTRDFGTRLEFVEGAAKDRLNSEFEGIAGKRRW